MPVVALATRGTARDPSGIVSDGDPCESESFSLATCVCYWGSQRFLSPDTASCCHGWGADLQIVIPTLAHDRNIQSRGSDTLMRTADVITISCGSAL
jgi:hypothetical protein